MYVGRGCVKRNIDKIGIATKVGKQVSRKEGRYVRIYRKLGW